MLLVDTHVHIYDCFDVPQLLDSAWKNFQAQAADKADEFVGVLLLTETARDHWFSGLKSRLQDHSDESLSEGQWTFSPTSEDCSVWALGPQGQKLLIVAGRQIVTAEKLEVLSLITHKTVPDGLSLEKTIQSIQANDGLVVLPWGVGKWLGDRGKLIEKIVESEQLSPFFLGDNSGRPKFWPRPDYFKTVEKRGQQVLPGTDPLPMASEASRPGSFGLAMPKTLDDNVPGAHLKTLFLKPDSHWQAYGQLETLGGFFRNQLAMRRSKGTKPSLP